MRTYLFLGSMAVFLLDQATKWAIVAAIPLHDSIQIIPRFFRLTRVENPGAAFGIFSENPSEWTASLLILFSLAALAVVSRLLWRNSHTLTALGIALALILGGALGNLWDRLVDGHVVDYLDFYLGNYHWPAFNVADSAIVVGALILVLEILFSKSASQDKAIPDGS